MTLTLREVDPREVASAAVASIRPRAQASELEVCLDLAEDMPLVRMDPDRIHQVFDNLLGNAIKFSREGGPVHVAGESRAGAVAFSVRDSGPGVPEKDAGRLFEPFWQAAQGDRRGAGLGLTICKQIVEAHGGRIELEPLERGSCFRFTLPH